MRAQSEERDDNKNWFTRLDYVPLEHGVNNISISF